jgi:RNA polymerase sigma-70 factor (ECF subfamily)
VSERSNSEWQEALGKPGPQRDAALEDLRARLSTGLRFALRSYRNVGPQDIDDFVQDALLRILDKLDTFRGESRFLTWAQKVAVHLAISELRRLRWRDVPLVHQTQDGEEIELLPEPARVAEAGRAAGVGETPVAPESALLRQTAMTALRRAIDEDLTERQRLALTAIVVHGMPLAEVALKMDTNRNALYKLLHDARKRLKKGLTDAGMSSDDILAVFESA